MGGRARQILFRIHAWIGLNLGLLLFLVCFSGTVAVFSHELNWLADSALRVETRGEGPARPASWQTMRDAVARAHPHAVILRLQAPEGAGRAARAVVAYGPGDLRAVLLDPATGEAIAQRSTFDVTSFFRIYHKQLYIVPVNLWIHGVLIVGTLGLALLAAVLTGVLSYRRWWRSFTRFRTGRSARVLWSDLHRMAGVWALAVSLVLAVTGSWYLVEYLLSAAGAMEEEPRPARLDDAAMRARPATLPPIDLDRAAGLAGNAFPGLRILAVSLPLRAGDPVTFLGDAEAWLVRPRANQVSVDPYDGTVTAIRRGTELPAFARWVETADPLHFGTFGGLASRLVWFACGVLICGGILTGLWGYRLRAPRDGNGARHAGLAMLSVLPGVAVVAASAYGTFAYGVAQQARSQAPSAVTVQPPTAIGPWRVVLSHAAVNPATDVTIRFLGDGHPNFRRAQVLAGGKSIRLRRYADRLTLRGDARAWGCDARCPIRLEIEGWDGRRHAAELTMGAGGHTRNIAGVPPLSAGAVAVMIAFVGLSLIPALGWVAIRTMPGGRPQAAAGRPTRPASSEGSR